MIFAFQKNLSVSKKCSIFPLIKKHIYIWIPFEWHNEIPMSLMKKTTNFMKQRSLHSILWSYFNKSKWWSFIHAICTIYFDALLLSYNSFLPSPPYGFLPPVVSSTYSSAVFLDIIKVALQQQFTFQRNNTMWYSLLSAPLKNETGNFNHYGTHKERGAQHHSYVTYRPTSFNNSNNNNNTQRKRENIIPHFIRGSLFAPFIFSHTGYDVL